MVLALIGGLLFMLAVACFSASLILLFYSLLTGSSIVVGLFCQYLIIVTMLVPISFIRKESAFFTTKHLLFFYRACLTVVLSLGYFKALEMLSLSEVGLILQLTPLFLLAIAWLFTGEGISWPLLATVGIGFLGSTLLYLPTIEILEFNSGLLFALISGVALASSLILARDLSSQSFLRPFLFYQAFYSLLIVAALMPFLGEIPTLSSLLFYLGAGAFSLLGSTFLFLAYQFGRPAELSPFIYTGAIFYIFTGFYTVTEKGVYSTIIGSCLILLSLIFFIIMQRVHQVAK